MIDINFFSKKRQEMIGIKVKNSLWEKALLGLLEKRAEIFQPLGNYQAVLTDLPFDAPDLKGIKRNSLIGIGNDSFQYSLKVPFKITDLESLLVQMIPTYENGYFICDLPHHMLKNKKDKREILLTEKEVAIITFLISSPKHFATKEELLKHVWQYTS